MNYSKNRKEPLSRKLTVTYDEEQVWDLFDSLVNTEMVGKGGVLIRGWKEYKKFNSRN